MLAAVIDALERTNASAGYAASTGAARAHLQRYRVDGVFVDLALPDADDLILNIRGCLSNGTAIVFACLPCGVAPDGIVIPGASFVLQRPLTPEQVISHLARAQAWMQSESRRFSRYSVRLPVHVKSESVEQRGMMATLGSGGMSLDVLQPVEHKSVIDFTFETPSGIRINGKGLVAWVQSEGRIGVKFQFIRGEGHNHLQAWLNDLQPMGAPPVAEGLESRTRN